MATKADFTEDEWKAMQKGVTGTGMLVSIGDRDFTDSFGEASALAKYLAEQSAQNESELIRELAHTHGTGFGMTASPQKIEAETLDSLRSATATLAAKAPDEANAYRELVLGVADHVANAKGGVQAGETAALDKITEALGQP
jgi:tellurite resistance protein